MEVENKVTDQTRKLTSDETVNFHQLNQVDQRNQINQRLRLAKNKKRRKFKWKSKKIYNRKEVVETLKLKKVVLVKQKPHQKQDQKICICKLKKTMEMESHYKT